MDELDQTQPIRNQALALDKRPRNTYNKKATLEVADISVVPKGRLELPPGYPD